MVNARPAHNPRALRGNAAGCPEHDRKKLQIFWISSYEKTNKLEDERFNLNRRIGKKIRRPCFMTAGT